MAKYGQIPPEFGGGNKYRLIWAPSRHVTLTGRETTLTIPLYSGPQALEPVGDFWIIERWKSCRDLTGMTKAEWESDPMMLNTGPYPANGDYVRCETLSVNPGQANVEKLITWIEEGEKRDPRDNTQFCIDSMEQGARDRKSQRESILRDAQRPFGAETFVGYGKARNSKTYPILKSREDLGLPAEGVTADINPRKKVVYEVPQHE